MFASLLFVVFGQLAYQGSYYLHTVTGALMKNDRRRPLCFLASAVEAGWSLKGVDVSWQQFDPPQSLLLPLLYELQTLVTNFADGAERDL